MNEQYGAAASMWNQLRREFLYAAEQAEDADRDAGLPKKRGSLLWRSFWASHQRFFRHMCMAAKVLLSVPMAACCCPCLVYSWLLQPVIYTHKTVNGLDALSAHSATYARSVSECYSQDCLLPCKDNKLNLIALLSTINSTRTVQTCLSCFGAGVVVCADSLPGAHEPGGSGGGQVCRHWPAIHRGGPHR